MNMVQNLIESGRIVDLMLLFVAIEVVVLLLYRQRTGRGLSARALLLNIGAGGSLMLALRATVMESGTAAVGFFLVLSLVFHVADLLERWPRGR